MLSRIFFILFLSISSVILGVILVSFKQSIEFILMEMTHLFNLERKDSIAIFSLMIGLIVIFSYAVLQKVFSYFRQRWLKGKK